MLLNTLLLLAAAIAPLKETCKTSDKLCISFEQAQELGTKIWKNECGGKIEGLTSWNEGEDFASVGIGHFIWYPKHRKKDYHETFPDVLIFMRSCGTAIPKWIGEELACPWRNRTHFLNNLQSTKMEEFRQFLYETKALQAIYMANRLEQALPRMTDKLELTKKRAVEKHFYALASTPNGLYALIDYLNFKGEGISKSERYKGKGWGLLQVLQRIPDNSIRPVDDFVKGAKEVLAERVRNAPSDKNEHRWLKGWNARLNTYLN